MADETPELPRRRLIGGLGLAGAGLVAGGGIGWGAKTLADRRAEAGSGADASGGSSGREYSPFGAHQSGITTPTPRHSELVAFDLLAGVDGTRLARLLRLWTTDIAAAMRGRPIPGDVVGEQAQRAVSLTVTVGVGAKVFGLPGVTAKRPTGFVDIPAMTHDRLHERWSGGDLVVLVAADDATTVAHVVRRLTVDAETFARVRWRQVGSWRGVDDQGRTVTGRNLFGQVDGTAQPGDDELDTVVWSADEGWVGGTQLVVRRIEMDVDEWDTLTRERQEKVVGRRIADGAPLTGGAEHDDLDLGATAQGTPVIALDAHARLAHPSQNRGRQILRRGLNYTHDEQVDGAVSQSSGLLFLSFQANIAEQFVPLQQQLDRADALNEWTTAIGSAVFAIAPGWDPEGADGVARWIGEGLFA